MLTNHTQPQQLHPHFTRKQLRDYKREAKAQSYRSGHAHPDKLEGDDADRALAARDKRARKNEKRAADAFKTADGQQRARDWLDGKAYAAGVYSAIVDETWAKEEPTITIGDHVYTGVRLISDTVEPA